MDGVADVVIVGGGIGGASLAYALAGAGLGVTVLEATEEYEDRVRGESMQVWGVKEARALGVESLLVDAGAHIAPVWKQYMEGFGDIGDIPMGLLSEGIEGTLNVRHPVACQALIDAAEANGATVVRGVRDVALTAGSSPSVSFPSNGGTSEISCGLVVGADGRASKIRKQAGITLEREEAISYIAGILLEGLDEIPSDHDVLVGENDMLFVLFHQGGGRARVYLCPGAAGQHRFAGQHGVQSFRDACALSSYPYREQVQSGTQIGPLATYPGDDTWTSAPYTDGVVLVGDSAGHNDPIIGQGLSIALRDARTVRDLVLDGARTPDAFASYGAERMERMRRLRLIADVMAVALAEDADNRSARRAYVVERMATMDPEVMSLMLGAFTGPETVPDERVDPGILDRIRAA
ncbi:MAG TPA: FAD-dependent monooxygenase [Acidimicrobiales bacterium]|jgi:2-polyprenyl-6-methoxyphenol hydroxylase-like FAD-dependent oxidoreductase